MQDRFKFNAVVSSYYDIDTPTNYEEHEPQFYLSDVDVFCNQEIGIDYDVLFDTVKQQVKNLSEKEIGQIMQHFEDNSNSPECDFVTIKPDKILQCTGFKDKNGKLIYEGDIVKDLTYFYEVKYVCAFLPIFGGLGLISNQDLKDYEFCKKNWESFTIDDKVRRLDNRFKLANQGNKLKCFNMNNLKMDDFEVIGNIYENPELIKYGE